MIKQFNLEQTTLELANPVPMHDDVMVTVRYRPIDEGTESSQPVVKPSEIRQNSQTQPTDKRTESSQSGVELSETRENAKIMSSMGYNMTQCSTKLDYKTLTVEAPNVDAWKTVVNEQLFVYSAFLDQRHEDYDFVKIVGIRQTKFKSPIQCQLWFDHGGPPLIILGRTTKFPEQPRLVVYYLGCQYQ